MCVCVFTVKCCILPWKSSLSSIISVSVYSCSFANSICNYCYLIRNLALLCYYYYYYLISKPSHMMLMNQLVLVPVCQCLVGWHIDTFPISLSVPWLFRWCVRCVAYRVWLYVYKIACVYVHVYMYVHYYYRCMYTWVFFIDVHVLLILL